MRAPASLERALRSSYRPARSLLLPAGTKALLHGRLGLREYGGMYVMLNGGIAGFQNHVQWVIHVPRRET